MLYGRLLVLHFRKFIYDMQARKVGHNRDVYDFANFLCIPRKEDPLMWREIFLTAGR